MKTLKGIDVSVHQGTVDWAKVAAAGIDFAILKAGYGWGNGTGKNFAANAAECERMGLPYGAYWYGYAGTPEQARAEADSCIAAIAEAGAAPALGVWYDLEEDSHAKMTAAALWETFKIFRETLAAAGYEAGIYSFKSILQKLYEALPEEMEKSKVWLAQLGKNTYAGHVDLWQYSHTGAVAGIGTIVDLNERYQKESCGDDLLGAENAFMKDKLERIKKILEE